MKNIIFFYREQQRTLVGMNYHYDLYPLAVIDPRNGEEISLERAVALGIINQREGKYVNPRTREAIPIPMAMNAGKIKVEITTTKKSEEKRRDMGLITIKTYKESRPFTVKVRLTIFTIGLRCC